VRRAKVLYISMHGLGAPLTRLHGLLQLKALPERGRSVSVLSFETRRKSPLERAQYELERRALSDAGIGHTAVPRLGSRWLEVPLGALVVLWLVVFRGVRTLHARSYVPAIMAVLVRSVTPARVVFDMRGLFVDEYILEGALRDGSAKLDFARRLERWLLARSDVLVVVSERFREHLLTCGLYGGCVDPSRISLIPNRVDLARFDSALERREEARARRGYEGQTVGVFAGSASPWHRLDLTAALMKRVMDARGDVRFVVAVYPSTSDAERVLREQGLPRPRTELLTVPTDAVPSLFAACDFGLMLIDEDISKTVCAPVKLGEYLASGLPVVAGGGIGDARDWVGEEGLGLLVDLDDIAGASRRVLEFLHSDAFVSGAARRRARAFAEERMDMSETVEQYERIYQSLDPR